MNQHSTNQGEQGDTAWLNAKPRLRPELHAKVRRDGEQLTVTIEDPTRGKFFQVGYEEYRLISMLDGKRTLEEVLEQLNSGVESPVTPESLQAVCQWLTNNHLLVGDGAATTERLSQVANQKNAQKWMSWLNPLCFKINLLNPNEALERIRPSTQWIFSRWMMVVWMVLGAWSVVEIFNHSDRFSESAAGILAPGKWLWLLAIWCVLKVVHETAHGIACLKFGGEVRRAGLLFLLFAPLAFVDVTSSWRMTSRRNRIIVASAGMYVELMLAFIATIIWARCETGLVADICYNVVVMAGISTVLFNANPLIRFDGYYILSDLLGVVNLYSKGQMWFADRWKNLLFGFAKSDSICPSSERLYVGIYGCLSFCWRITLSLSLLLVASTLFDGFGLALAAVGSVFWIGMPIFRTAQQLKKTADTQSVNYVRLVSAVSILGLLGSSLFFWIQAPVLTRAPLIVQFQDEHVLRADSDGFVSEILVTNGQEVEQDQPLLVLENPQLMLELEELKVAAETARIQARIYQKKGELSQVQSETNRLATVQSQIQEKQKQIDRLTICAPISGVVYRRGLENLQQSFVKQGDAVIRIAHPGSKELLVSLDQNQIKTVRQNLDKPIWIDIGGLPIMQASMNTVEPRASDQLAHESMGAHCGGPLQVRQLHDSEDSDASKFRLIKPRFTAKLQLDQNFSSSLRSGQLGTAFVHGRNETFGSYLYEQCRQWVRKTIETASKG